MNINDINMNYSKQDIPIIGSESIMSKKAHGTSNVPVMKNLRYNVDWDTADRICNFNRHYAEHAGYFRKTTWWKEVKDKDNVIYYDSNSGLPLFIAPRNRSAQEFYDESLAHGWPSFRDDEVVWENVRVLEQTRGEVVSVSGTHLGHNLPDKKGNRYCINLVCVAGNPKREE